MFQKLRAIHLCTSLFALAFLLMYGVSGVQMAHSAWFPMKPAITTATFTLPPGLTDARVAARELMDKQFLRGELQTINVRPSHLRFRIVRPGTVYDVHYAVLSGVTNVSTSTAGFLGMLNRLHHVEGLYHEYALINVWGMLAALISLALFLLGATGLYLWFANHRERWIGGALLAGGLALTLTLLVSMRGG